MYFAGCGCDNDLCVAVGIDIIQHRRRPYVTVHVDREADQLTRTTEGIDLTLLGACGTYETFYASVPIKIYENRLTVLNRSGRIAIPSQEGG